MTQLLTGVEFLGCIYDIYGYYARANSVKTDKRLFSLPDADTEIAIYDTDSGEGIYKYPSSAVSVARFYEADQTTITSETTEEIYSSFTVSADMSGSKGLFSAEVSAKYSESHTESSYFYHIEESGYAYSYRLTADLDYMKANLDSDFSSALNNVTDKASADQLVETYGTHFLYEGVFGGRWSYTQSVSKFSYTDKTEAEAKVQANYASYSGSVSASNQTDYSQSNNQSNGEFWCIGGTPGTLVDGFDDWAESVPGNYALVDFSSNSLKKISELTDDTTIKTLVETAIQEVLDAGENPTTTSLTYNSVEYWVENVKIIGGSKKIIPDNIEEEMWPQDGYVVVGFGGNVNNNGDFNRIAVCLLDLSTGQREWKAQEDGNTITFNQTEYETIGEVPYGCVLTGIGLSGKKQNFRRMVLHYQELAPITPTTYLDSQVSSKAFKFQQEADEPKDSYDVEFKPDGNEGKVIVGIGVAYISDTNTLRLHRAALEEA